MIFDFAQEATQASCLTRKANHPLRMYHFTKVPWTKCKRMKNKRIGLAASINSLNPLNVWLKSDDAAFRAQATQTIEYHYHHLATNKNPSPHRCLPPRSSTPPPQKKMSLLLGWPAQSYTVEPCHWFHSYSVKLWFFIFFSTQSRN